MNNKETLKQIPQPLYLFYLIIILLLASCGSDDGYKPGELALKATVEAPYTTDCTVYDPKNPESIEYRANGRDIYVNHADICALQEIGFTPEKFKFVRERVFYTEYQDSEGITRHCTSFLVQQTPGGAVLATNKHCSIREGTSLKIIRPGFEANPVNVMVRQKNSHPNFDLATLLIPRSSVVPPDLTPIPIAMYSPIEFDPMVTIGFPQVMVENQKTSVQVVRMSNTKELIAKGISGRGSSGSPGIMLLENGVPSPDGTPHVVGIVWGSPGYEGNVLLPELHPQNTEEGKVVYMVPGSELPDILVPYLVP